MPGKRDRAPTLRARPCELSDHADVRLGKPSDVGRTIERSDALTERHQYLPSLPLRITDTPGTRIEVALFIAAPYA